MTHTEPAIAKDPRRHDLDALRAFAMLLGIGLHAAMSFFTFPVWYVQDQHPIAGIDRVVSSVHGFRMPLFFLLSGFFTAMLWKRRGVGGLLKQRALRIAFPLGLGCATIVPAMWMVTAWASTRSSQAATPAAVSPDATIWSAAREDNAAAIRVLAEGGADVNAADGSYQMTPLAWAAVGDSAEAVAALIELGADPNKTYGMGSTALHTAMFFGNAKASEALIDGGSDLTIKDPWGSTPEATMTAPQSITMGFANAVGLGKDWDTINADRQQIQEMLEARGVEQAPPTFGERLGGIVRALIAFPFFQHLWFLWYLCWLVGIFAVLVPIVKRVPGLSAFPKVLIATPLCLLWLVPLTMTTQRYMSSEGTSPGFGPDTFAGILPMPYLLAHYAIFFLFGAVVYTRQGAADRLGRGWWLMLPAALVLFPFALALGYQTAWGNSLIADEGARRVVAVLAQVLYAWLMTFGLMGLFETVLAKERAWVRWVSDSSYWLYLVHLPLIIAAQAWLAGMDAPGGVKLAGLLLTSTALLLLSYRYLVRYTPIGWLLNGRRAKPVKTIAAPSPDAQPAA